MGCGKEMLLHCPRRFEWCPWLGFDIGRRYYFRPKSVVNRPDKQPNSQHRISKDKIRKRWDEVVGLHHSLSRFHVFCLHHQFVHVYSSTVATSRKPNRMRIEYHMRRGAAWRISSCFTIKIGERRQGIMTVRSSKTGVKTGHTRSNRLLFLRINEKRQMLKPWWWSLGNSSC